MKNLFYALALLFIASCSTSDSSSPVEDSTFAPIDTKILTSNGDALMLYEIEADSDAIIATNLTATLGVPYDYRYAKYDNGSFRFAKRFNNDFDFWSYDTTASSGEAFGQFCELEPNEGVIVASNSIDKFLVLSRISESETLFNYAHVFDLRDGTYLKQFYANGGLGPNTIKVVSNQTALVYMYGSTGVELYKLNLNTLDVDGFLTLGSDARITVNDGLIHLFYQSGTYQVLELDSFTEVSNTTIDFPLTFYANGFFEADFYDNLMRIDLAYPQPSPFSIGPALVNLDSGEFTAGDDFFLFELRDTLAAALGEGVQGFSVYRVSLNSDVIAIGYATVTNQFGVLYTNFAGDILATIALDQLPTEIYFN